jgi:cyclophilin family peptidyl-prolyl cis-trans isomerase
VRGAAAALAAAGLALAAAGCGGSGGEESTTASTVASRVTTPAATSRCSTDKPANAGQSKSGFEKPDQVLEPGQKADVVMTTSCGVITIHLDQKLGGPIANSVAFLARKAFFDGLTFHRVVPNFVIQGGSPNANEYSGAKEYMRDEIASGNGRGTVGLSTRGRNTADAQFFVNLVDNPRLNGDYTVFARVLDADMPLVDRIQEGEVMRSITLTKCETVR